MPWKEKTVEELREEFVEAAKKAQNFSALCRAYGITRRTGYKWVARASVGESPSGRFANRSTAPKRIANKTPMETEQFILACRDDNPAWGGKTIRKTLENEGKENLPSVKTCNNILKRNGRVDPAESLKHKPFQRFERENCNELWQTDFKGDFALCDGSRCYPLTILDDHSRFSILIDPKQNTIGVKDSFIKAFGRFGMPGSILSDNGSQFAGFKGGYTSFERWLMDLDILPIHCRIMHPQTQGKIERFHRTMNQELLKRASFVDLSAADASLQAWRLKYNEQRPHEALSMKTPSQVYVPSSKVYTGHPDPFEYSGLFPIRKVNNWGFLRFNPISLYLSETMADTYLEIRPVSSDNSFTICYRNFKIAEVDAASNSLINRKIFRL